MKYKISHLYPSDFDIANEQFEDAEKPEGFRRLYYQYFKFELPRKCIPIGLALSDSPADILKVANISDGIDLNKYAEEPSTVIFREYYNEKEQTKHDLSSNYVHAAQVDFLIRVRKMVLVVIDL